MYVISGVEDPPPRTLIIGEGVTQAHDMTLLIAMGRAENVI